MCCAKENRRRAVVRAVPMAANRYRHLHWGAKRREVLRWQLLLRSGFQRRSRPAATTVAVTIRVYRAQLQDPDNAVASLKPVLDALVRLGWAVDDSAAHLKLDAREVKCRRVEQRTEVEVRPV